MAEHAEKNLLQSSLSPCLPLLVFHHRNDENDDDEMLMFSVPQQSLHENMGRGLLTGGGAMSWPTPQGWMLLLLAAEAHDDDDDTSSRRSACLWNPLTGDKLALPDIGEEHEIPLHCRCLLSHNDPAHPDCAVVLLHYAAAEMWYCHTGHGAGGGAGWKHHAYDIGDYPLPTEYRAPTKKVISMVTSFQGKLHLISSPTDMYAIDLSSPTRAPTFRHYDVELLDNFPPGMSTGKDWLVESRGELFLVGIRFVGFDLDDIGAIFVYKMDTSSSSSSTRSARWRRVRDIGDAVFLLEDENMAASCGPASALGLHANRIYFMKNLKEDDADLCVFYLESDAQQITRVHHHDGLLLCRKPFWILPPSRTYS